MDENLKLEVIHANQLTSEQRMEIHALCNRTYAVYNVDLEPLSQTPTDATMLSVGGAHPWSAMRCG